MQNPKITCNGHFFSTFAFFNKQGGFCPGRKQGIDEGSSNYKLELIPSTITKKQSFITSIGKGGHGGVQQWMITRVDIHAFYGICTRGKCKQGRQAHNQRELK